MGQAYWVIMASGEPRWVNGTLAMAPLERRYVSRTATSRVRRSMEVCGTPVQFLLRIQQGSMRTSSL
nr:hypothetical protein [Haloactinospora alba]